MQVPSPTTISDEKRSMKAGPSTMAESMLLEDRSIFLDPCAVHFVGRQMLEWARDHPLETTAIAKKYDRKMPGWSTFIRTRARYFDDVVQNAGSEGFSPRGICPGTGGDSE
mgnify:CR=1 FL=1